ncbi:hypothetical protein NC652_012941 [Populus alba x Populus x berolinensis]|nr:hypothetical protein NC652_012941 [Populus alba x Populus x berolinensis]
MICLPVLSDIIPKETLIWRLKLLQSAAAYANSRLHAVRAESLVLAGSVNKIGPGSPQSVVRQSGNSLKRSKNIE